MIFVDEATDIPREMYDIPPYLRRKRNDLAEGWETIAAIVLVVFLATLLSFYLNAFPTPIVHADEPIHQNDYYCRQIRDDGVKVLGGSEKQLQDLCAEYGISL